MSTSNNKLVNYIKTSKAELKKVVWPTRKEILLYTLLVIGISLSLALFFGVLDYLFTLGVEFIIK